MRLLCCKFVNIVVFDFESELQGFLTDEALAGVKSLLPDYAEGELANVCSWPDEIRHSYRWRWSGPLHYIDVPDFVCNYNYCSKTLSLLCVYLFDKFCHILMSGLNEFSLKKYFQETVTIHLGIKMCV